MRTREISTQLWGGLPTTASAAAFIGSKRRYAARADRLACYYATESFAGDHSRTPLLPGCAASSLSRHSKVALMDTRS